MAVRILPGDIGRRLLGVVWLLASYAAQAEPWTPDNDNEVIEQLTTSLFFETTPLQQQLQTSTDDPKKAAKLARQYISIGRRQSDPRYFGYAQAAIHPWQQQAQPPSDILLIRATLKQHHHHYQAAVTDLQKLTQSAPGNAQAWLTLSSIQLVQGHYPQAKNSCAGLARNRSGWLSLLCYGQVMALSENAERGYALITTLLRHIPDQDLSTRQWLQTLLAEISTREGKPQQAEKHFKRALAIPQRDPYLLRVYSEYLRNHHRASEVLSLLKHESHDDALLLELALAARKSGKKQQLITYKKALKERFQAEKLRGSTLHRREYARFLLDIEQQDKQALTLAKANWALQKEPADAHLLLDAAIKNRDLDSIQTIIDWQNRFHIQDQQLRSLLNNTGIL